MMGERIAGRRGAKTSFRVSKDIIQNNSWRCFL
ncbi:hypothetical protein X929_08860 [Petrotoga olearia DSM 13574]|uniref:Uncharacterized protein n=1 Tax=Petrotoga olearia DSM 13574 TaxID=1122955 RepID=A0A2K1NX75_9BACT|nr:hypothetical protein X929_08860 [Petrotoga olearia DSM 13574]